MTISTEQITKRKKQLRKQLLSKRRKLSETALRHISNRIYTRLIELDAFLNAKVVHSYIPIKKNKEVYTWDILDKAHQMNKKVVVPVMDMKSSHMDHYEINPRKTPLKENKLGIPQPNVDKALENNGSFDLIIVPMVGGDHFCNRLGYGRGYYDRFLDNQSSAVTIGVMPDACLLSKIPVEEHDIPLHGIITENTICMRGGKI